MSLWLYLKGHRYQTTRAQRPDSRRLTPIKVASEATNRTAAAVNVGTGVGEKAGAATSFWRMVETFRKWGWFWK